MPIGGVAGQTGDLQPHDDAGLAQGNLADEALEAMAHKDTHRGADGRP